MHFISKALSVIISCAVLMSSSGLLASLSSVSNSSSEFIISAHAAELSEEIVTESAETAEDSSEVSETPFDVFGIYDAYKNYASTTTTTTAAEITTTTTTTTTIKKGIDVSEHQASVDWTKVKSAGVEFAIIRAGYGKEYDQEDLYFDQNIVNAQKNGLDCGVYWYSYADSVEDAYREAEVCYSMIKDYDYEYPVYFDIEEKKHANMTTAEVSAIIEAFCSTMKNKGYRVGLYSYANFLSTKVYTSVLQKYDIWVAHFGAEKPEYSGEYGIWQYSCTGRVDGISGDVDLNYGYVDYAKLTSAETTQTTTTTTTTTASSSDSSVTTTTTTISTEAAVKNGINVSMWQGDIDWTAVKESGIEFAIVRAGYGNEYSQEDPYFDQNMINAQAAGIDCGAYWYSYALTAEEAVQEAEVCYSVIKDYTYQYPIIFAIEDATQSSLTNEQISAIIEAFCSTLEEKGYYVAVQSYASLLSHKVDSSILEKYDVCVEHFNVDTPSYTGAYTMWHYSCTGQVKGISGDVNLLYAYADYTSIISKLQTNSY